MGPTVSRDNVTYQREDQAFADSVFADATLSTSLLAVTTGWRGFVASLAKANTANPVAAGVTGFATNPAATGTYRLGYGTDLQDRRGLSSLLSGLPAIVYCTLIVQPSVALSTVYQLSEPIRTRFAVLAKAAGIVPNETIPLAQGPDLGTWSTWSLLLRART